MSIGKIPDNVINLLLVREAKQREKVKEKNLNSKTSAGLKIKEKNLEIAIVPSSETIIEVSPEAKLDCFSVEYTLFQIQEKMQKAQSQCLTSFEIYQKFMLETNGFAEVLEQRLYAALANYKQIRQEYIQLAREASLKLS